MSESPMARGAAWPDGLRLASIALAVGAVLLPILLAAAPATAEGLGDGGRVALLASAVLSVAVVGGALLAAARRQSAAGAWRIERGILLAAAAAAVVVLLMFPAQLSVFALAWPPPEGAAAYYDLLLESRWIGLLSLDLLLMIDWIVLLVFWAGMYVMLRPTAPKTMLLVLAMVVASTLAYFVSNTAFDMVALSTQYAEATTVAERASLVAAGDAALARFEGPWFTFSYVVNGVAVLVASIVMWRAPRMGRWIGGAGVLYGVLQLVPPNAGALGMAMSLASLVPMLAWLALSARKLLRARTSRGP